ncbi:hypothetical protein EI71_00886 [Anaeroplasma bactoclasticum]|uniref:Uncharacterized protein n=1 Tax=Anaeroplasma bactoclasticum TaxID=2088 RepID=A0A397RU74_9MOLU|nr:hypothetical protein [Anaeroplasma bactoclasticum]RIA77733.1 hypothetical protein EI71_00886 [Anaeroplasma bactoclasticum]
MMKESKFIIYDFIFSSRKKNLEKSLKEYGIPYKDANNTICFETHFENETQKWYAEYKKDKILFLSFFCESENPDDSSAIRDQLKRNYLFVNHDTMAMVDNYVCTSDRNINIFVEITQVFRIRISFVPEGINTNHRVKDSKENIYLALNIVLGLGLSSICFFLYNLINLKWLNILMAVFSIVFMLVSCFFLSLGMDGSRKKSLIVSVIFSLVYWGVVFVFLLIINQNSIPDIGQRVVNSTYYAIYAMPSYIVVVIVAFLIMAAASYA